LPDEVQFESLATRVRTFTLKCDRLYWPKVLDALDRLTGLEDQRLRSWSEQLRQAWTKATERWEGIHKLLRNLGVVEDLCGQVAVGFHGTNHRTDELVLQVWTGRELSQRVVLRLLLEGFAFFEPVFDVGDDVSHARIRVCVDCAVAEQVLDLNRVMDAPRDGVVLDRWQGP
jgi:hypothetical protein